MFTYNDRSLKSTPLPSIRAVHRQAVRQLFDYYTWARRYVLRWLELAESQTMKDEEGTKRQWFSRWLRLLLTCYGQRRYLL